MQCRLERDELTSVKKLRQLRDENIETRPIDFFVGDIPWTDTIAAEIIQTFEFYAHQRWNEGSFHVSSADTGAHLFQRVLHVAVQNRLFRGYRFCATHNNTSPNLELSFANSLADVMRNGTDVERITIQCFDISSAAASILARGLIHDDSHSTYSGLRELVFDGNRFVMEAEVGHSAVQLASGLSRNKSLCRLALTGAFLYDSTLKVLFDSVIGHPQLQALQVTFSDFGPETISSVQRMLSSPSCQVQELELSHLVSLSAAIPTRTFNMQAFVLRLPINHSLRSLTLSKQELRDFDVNLLLKNLWKLPKLRTLNLQLNRIQDFVVATQNLLDSPTAAGAAAARTTALSTSRLRTLNLDYNECFANEKNTRTPFENDRTRVAILRLLDAFPQLGYLGNDFIQLVEDSSNGCGDGVEWPIPVNVQHRMDMNRSGGHLLHDLHSSSSFPLSLWPLVLARANDTWRGRPSRQANICYHFLREGPAFGARNALS